MSAADKLAALLQEGTRLHQRGRLAEAERAYRQALRRAPGNADAMHLLGLLRLDAGDLDGARRLIEAALAQLPNHPVLLNSLGETLRRGGEADRAEALFRQALSRNPDYAEALHNLGKVMAGRNRFAAAIECFEHALRIAPANARAWADLGDTLRLAREPARALEACRRACALAPELAPAHNALGLALKKLGRLAEAREVFEGFATRSRDRVAVSNLLLTACYDPELDPAALRRLHETHAAPLYPSAARGARPREGEAPRRIGFVSGDLREHALRFFLLPLLEGLGEIGVERFAYHSAPLEDATTALIGSRLETYRQVATLDDEALARRIREDRIDVLVDLSGHTGFNRLGLFARRPAALQLSWVGYLATSGLRCFDAHVGDPTALPAGSEAWFSEPIARLPRCQWCYQPPAESPPASHAEPASPVFTFGALHATEKLNPQVIALWRSILEACPQSRLLLMADGVEAIAGALGRGLPALADGSERVRVLATGSLQSFLAAHRQVDLTLDSFPYTGGTTGFHSLWMGVPVLTLGCAHPAGRGGASILTALGRQDLIASDLDEYRTLACALAGRGAELRGAREQLRERLQASPLTDARGFAEDFWQLACTLHARRDQPR